MAESERTQIRQDYQDALALVNCLSEVCPRSCPSEKLERAVGEILAKSSIEDTAMAMRTKPIDLSKGTEYVEVMAGAWRKMKACGLGAAEVQQILQAEGIDCAKQDEERRSMASSLEPGWKGVRFRDMVLGCGIGDSFGAGVEFWDCQWIHRHVDGKSFLCCRGDPVLSFYYSGPDLIPDMAGAGQNFLPGMYTDDCEMTLGLMHALMSNIKREGGELTGDQMLQFWTDEYFKGSTHYLLTRFWSLAGIGRNGHGGIAFVFSGIKSIESMRARIADMRYPGNAPPMRALPLAFVPNDTVMVRLARANADSTHPHVKARAASLGIAVAGRLFVIEQTSPTTLIAAVGAELSRLDGLGAECPGVMLDGETLEYLKEVDILPAPGPLDSRYDAFMSDSTLASLCGPQPTWRGPDDSNPDGMPRMVRGLGADAQRTLGCVLYLLKHHNEGQAMETLLRSLYIGGDVDSLAALCLAMVGGREGLGFGTPSGVPMYMLEKLESVEYIVACADAFEKWAASQ